MREQLELFAIPSAAIFAFPLERRVDLISEITAKLLGCSGQAARVRAWKSIRGRLGKELKRVGLPQDHIDDEISALALAIRREADRLRRSAHGGPDAA